MNQITDPMTTKDEMESFTEDELRILIEGFDSDFFQLLLDKYKFLREVHLNRKIKSATPVTGALAMKAIGEIQGQNLELVWFFNMFPNECRRTLIDRKKVKIDETAPIDRGTVVNLLADY